MTKDERNAQSGLWILLGCALHAMACSATEPKAEDTELMPAGGGSKADASGECATFESTFEAIQAGVFEKHGCTASACHGAEASGDLDLRAGASYDALVEVPSSGTGQLRIQPLAPMESYLYLKLRAAVEPGSVAIANSPMPLGLPPLGEGELEAVRLWIAAGAPRDGVVGDPSLGGTDTIGALLNACLPEVEPIDVTPLEPPPPGEGVQFVSPPWVLSAGTEREICIATYYDFSDVVPDEFQSEDGTKFYVNGSRLRQDAGSHHWVLSNPGLDESFASDPSFGTWACHGGALDGSVCDPLDLASCGIDGVCASEMQDALACIGFGPTDAAAGTVGLLTDGLIENVQAPSQYLPPREGVYRELPIKGFLYHNSHAFNLTREDHAVDARLNVFYAKDRRRQLTQALDYSNVYLATGIPPFTIEEVCADHVAPAGAEMIRLTSHTHKRGKRFAVTLGGEMIYESFIYSDPLYKEFDPPVVFGQTEAERTMTACATYNNGVADNGAPDPDTVTRSSRMPERTTCTPIACVYGKIGAPCNGPEDHATCDSEPGAGDGLCDACAITAGPTTEDEMFVVMPWYVLPESAAP